MLVRYLTISFQQQLTMRRGIESHTRGTLTNSGPCQWTSQDHTARFCSSSMAAKQNIAPGCTCKDVIPDESETLDTGHLYSTISHSSIRQRRQASLYQHPIASVCCSPRNGWTRRAMRHHSRKQGTCSAPRISTCGLLSVRYSDATSR